MLPIPRRDARIFGFRSKLECKNIDWILTRDFNMTEDRMDLSGPLPLTRARGNKLIEWRLLVSIFNFIDTLTLLGRVEGSCFTKRRLHGLCLDQSRIDRIYFSGSGWWPHKAISLKHIQMLGISDHELVVVSIHIIQPARIERVPKKSTYFKVNPTILRNKENILEMEIAWKAVEIVPMDPHMHFFFAFECLRQKCKDLQPKLKPLDRFRSMLQEELHALSLEHEFVESEDLILDWERLKANLFEMECEEAIIWKRNTRMKGLDVGNEPSAFFFQVNQEK